MVSENAHSDLNIVERQTRTPGRTIRPGDEHLVSEGIELSAATANHTSEILTEGALRFVAMLTRSFNIRREALLDRRIAIQNRLDRGIFPSFLPETEAIRNREWTIAPVQSDICDRRVEITGPAGDTKMVINAFNSGANIYMADFEDSQSPTWDNTIRGQENLFRAVRGTLEYVSDEGKSYSLNPRRATLFVRPRGLHLLEKHLLIDGKPVSASLFDFGLFFFHNADALIKSGSAPYFYLPKMENHLEARLWNDVFNCAESTLGISQGTIKATVLIETILASFEMDEILYELRDHSAGLNCGRWDYIFSFIKKFRAHSRFVLPDRDTITMEKSFLASYVKLLIQTCHRRGAHAMGGMSAYIPNKRDAAANAMAMEKVRNDKVREALAGHDGTWVGHPGLVQLARDVFDTHMPQPNQINALVSGDHIGSGELLAVPNGTITTDGLRKNVNVALQYLEAWLGGTGAVPLYNLMEDAATAEICRAQVWQWIRHRETLNGGNTITTELVRSIIAEELGVIHSQIGTDRFNESHFKLASELFDQMVTAISFTDFLTVPAYDHL